MKRILTTAATLVLILTMLPPVRAKESIPAAQSGESGVWVNYANGNKVVDLALEDHTLWAATDGGVVRWDLANGTYVHYTTANGLSGSEVNCVTIDEGGHKWFGTWGG